MISHGETKSTLSWICDTCVAGLAKDPAYVVVIVVAGKADRVGQQKQAPKK
jgi:hypothetical protein